MSHNLVCYRCGAALAALSLPLSRQDECPECSVHLHVCRMCRHFDRNVPRQCREDGAEDVSNKERANFCDWFLPGDAVFDAAGKARADQARASLDALFGDGELPGPADDVSAADALFKRND